MWDRGAESRGKVVGGETGPPPLSSAHAGHLIFQVLEVTLTPRTLTLKVRDLWLLGHPDLDLLWKG